MSVPDAARGRSGPGARVGAVIAAVLGLPAGLFGAMLAMWPLGVAGGVLAVTGGVALSSRARWGLPVLVLGAALLLGIAAYIGLGLIQPDGPACGGDGCPAP